MIKVESVIKDYDYHNELNEITVRSTDLGCYGNVEVSINNKDSVIVNGKELIKAIENALNN